MAVLSRHLAGVLLPLIGSLAATAEFESWTSARFWYVSAGVAPAPDDVEEDTTGPGGGSTYLWEDPADDVAPRIALGYLAATGGASGGWALGAEVVATTAETTPERYEVAGLTFDNTSTRDLRYSTFGVTLFGGYQFGLTNEPDELTPFLILAPFIGGGVALADSEVRDQNGTYANDSAIGWYLEGGLRAGLYLTEKRWLLGAHVDVTVGTGEVDIDFGNNTTSTLTHERVGVGGSLVVGYRR